MTKPTKLILLSGGLDSAFLAHNAKQGSEPVAALHIDLGEVSSEPAIRAARLCAAQLDMPLHVLSLGGVFPAISDLAGGGGSGSPNPGNHVLELGTLLLYAPAIVYAHDRGYTAIQVGLTELDARASKEYQVDFLRALTNLSAAAGKPSIVLEAPLIAEKKSAIVGKLPMDLVVLTWSCALQGPEHCGRCQGCRSRRGAFQQAGMADRTRYMF